jgi:hypothetical protein
MDSVMDRLERLPVGMDLLHVELDDRFLPAYASIVSDLVRAVARQIGWFDVIARLRDLPESHELREYIRLAGTEVHLERRGQRALPLLLDVLAHDLPSVYRDTLKCGVLAACSVQGVPLPTIGVGVEEVGGKEVR